MRRGRVAVVALGMWLVLAATPAGAQITTEPPQSTQPLPTAPPTTEPPPDTTPSTAPPPTRPRPSTTKGGSTTTTVAVTTTITLLPPPSVAPQDPAVPPTGSTQSDRISSFFAVLSIVGFLAAIGMLLAQYFLTKPGREGWTL